MKKWRNFLDEVKKKRKTIACVICVKEKDKILVIKRSKDEDSKQGHWDLPGGHVDDEDQSIEAGALRELEEETGLTAAEKDLIYVTKVETDDADKYFYTTGRLTSEMVIKTVQMGIPILISRSGFTAWGVELAREVGLTLIGRARGNRFVALAGESRILFDS